MTFDINYEKEIFYGKLQRMALRRDANEISLDEYWCCNFDPKLSPIILRLIKSELQYTSEPLKHLKRMYKVERNGKTLLRALLCPVIRTGDESNDTNFAEVFALVKLVLPSNSFKIEKVEVPMNKPTSKELNEKVSKLYWPVIWKGDPRLQELKEIYKRMDINKVEKYVGLLIEKLENPPFKTSLPIVTIFVDPLSDEIKSISYDSRTRNNPIKHPIMDGIAHIAELELRRRQESCYNDNESNNYLCLNYHVYSTHEPCAMCAMALLHSRISQLIYIKPSTKTGAIGMESGHQEMVHVSCSLNWKFESFQYTDTSIANSVVSVDQDVFV